MARLRAAGCVFAEDEAGLLLEAAAGDQLELLVRRRVTGEPLEQVLGWAEFCGLRITVEPGVFVPRRRTELLVRQALAVLRRHAAREADVSHHRPPLVVDLCCGSGAVAAAIRARAPAAEVHAADVDPAAVGCARRNLPAERVHEGDLYAALPAQLRGRVDVLVVNAPYVPTDHLALMPPEARLYEARVALDGGADGVDVQRRVVDEAAPWLAPGGHLLVETGAGQVPRTVEAFAAHGFVTRVARSPRLGGTVVVGTPAVPARPSR